MAKETVQNVQQEELKVQSTLSLHREAYKGKDGNKHFSYFVPGKVRGIDVKIHFWLGEDKGNTDALKVLFGEASAVDLLVIPSSYENQQGEVVNYFKYVATSHDEDGTLYEVAVKPNGKTDKDLLKKAYNLEI